MGEACHCDQVVQTNVMFRCLSPFVMQTPPFPGISLSMQEESGTFAEIHCTIAVL